MTKSTSLRYWVFHQIHSFSSFLRISYWLPSKISLICALEVLVLKIVLLKEVFMLISSALHVLFILRSRIKIWIFRNLALIMSFFNIRPAKVADSRSIRTISHRLISLQNFLIDLIQLFHRLSSSFVAIGNRIHEWVIRFMVFQLLMAFLVHGNIFDLWLAFILKVIVINDWAFDLGQILREIHFEILHLVLDLRDVVLVLAFVIWNFKALLDHDLL